METQIKSPFFQSVLERVSKMMIWVIRKKKKLFKEQAEEMDRQEPPEFQQRAVQSPALGGEELHMPVQGGNSQLERNSAENGLGDLVDTELNTRQ